MGTGDFGHVFLNICGYIVEHYTQCVKNMLQNSLVVIPFNAQLKDGCDYALQTISILSKSNTVVGVVLAEPYSWLDAARDVWHWRSRRQWRVIDQPKKNMYMVRPVMLIPGQRWWFIKNSNIWLSALFLKLWLQVRGLIPSDPTKSILWFFEPYFIPNFLKIFGDFRSVYDCVDRFAPLGEEARQAEAYIKKNVEYMTVISTALLNEHSQDRTDIVKVPLGFDEHTFKKIELSSYDKTAVGNHHRKLTIGFCGGINYRFDFPLLFSLIKKNPEHTFWFVGPQQLVHIPGDLKTAVSIKKLLSFPNVTWSPAQPKSKMPSLIAKMDVCLIPYDMKYEFNRYCHPMKVAEYLCAGKPIISTPILEFEQPLYAELVLVGKTAQEFHTHIQRVLNEGWSGGVRRRQRAAALSQSWRHKVQVITQLLASAEAAQIEHS